jgi:hypothetical protein
LSLGILFLHFALVIIYANPFSSKNGKFDSYAKWYVYPWFHQAWNLFVPPPDCNYKLLARYENSGNQCADIFNEIVLKHQTNRLRGYGPVLIAFVNSIHYFEKNATQKDINGPVTNDINFKILEHAVLNYINHTRNLHLSKIKLILLVENIHDAKPRVYFN